MHKIITYTGLIAVTIGAIVSSASTCLNSPTLPNGKLEQWVTREYNECVGDRVSGRVQTYNIGPPKYVGFQVDEPCNGFGTK